MFTKSPTRIEKKPKRKIRSGGGVLESLAFPQISKEKTGSHLQFRIYNHVYNEETVHIGDSVRLFRSEDDQIAYLEHDSSLGIDGVITGVRVMEFDSMPEANQHGVVNHFGEEAITEAGGKVLMFWIDLVFYADWSKKEPSEVNDITNW